MADEDITAGCIAHGMLPIAVQDVLIQYPNDGSEPLVTWLDRIKPTVPHRYPPPEIDDGVNPLMIERAFGATPTMFARGDLLRLVGPDLYSKLMASWGASASNLKPGTNPKATTETQVKDAVAAALRKPKASNPWSKDGWNVTAQGRLVQSIGLDKAAAIAAAAGSKIGATKYNPDYA
jgi:hypothetical protein